jgi:hypothetical protein
MPSISLTKFPWIPLASILLNPLIKFKAIRGIYFPQVRMLTIAVIMFLRISSVKYGYTLFKFLKVGQT